MTDSPISMRLFDQAAAGSKLLAPSLAEVHYASVVPAVRNKTDDPNEVTCSACKDNPEFRKDLESFRIKDVIRVHYAPCMLSGNTLPKTDDLNKVTCQTCLADRIYLAARQKQAVEARRRNARADLRRARYTVEARTQALSLATQSLSDAFVDLKKAEEALNAPLSEPESAEQAVPVDEAGSEPSGLESGAQRATLAYLAGSPVPFACGCGTCADASSVLASLYRFP